MGRIAGQGLSDAWGKQVIVDNRPGGIADKRSPTPRRDGHTLMTMSGTPAEYFL